MSLQFYTSIIEEEKKIFNVKEKMIEKAVKDVITAYSAEALKNGSTFLDYNNPRNRCAYIYKYSVVHTGLVDKYFTQMIENSTVKSVLEYQKDIKICCLGGGSGTDIVGLFKSLAAFSCFHKKVSQVTVLDLCGGWRNSFKHIISRLKHGKVPDVPLGFVDSSNFKADLIEVNLLEPLPSNVEKILSSADIISMVKFVSAIQGKEESVTALEVIGHTFKLGAIVLFVDNYSNKVWNYFNDIALLCGCSVVLGPLRGVYQCNSCKTSKTQYGYSPAASLCATVIGWVKTADTRMAKSVSEPDTILTEGNGIADDDSWDTDSDSEAADIKGVSDAVNNTQELKRHVDKTSQTEPEYFTQNDNNTNMVSELSTLVSALSDLAIVLRKRKANKCHCRCGQV